MDETTLVAWWGAIIATLVLIWDVTKWFREGPRIKHRLKLNTGYLDGDVVSREATEHGEIKQLATYCHIELVNAGKLPTTIMGIEATHHPGPDGQMISTVDRFKAHYGKQLPHVLGPGEVWSCRLRMEDLYRLGERGCSQINVTLSNKDRPLVIKPRLTTKVGASAAA